MSKGYCIFGIDGCFLRIDVPFRSIEYAFKTPVALTCGLY
jgi:hypothetical protein